MMGKVELPLHALRAQVASSIDVVVQVTRFNDGRRGLTQVAEVLPLDDNGRYHLADIFTYVWAEGAAGEAGGRLEWTGQPSRFAGEPKVRVQRRLMGPAADVFAAEDL